jgi:lipopolysaccharide/colanic/teichoic acid biosynthesis glycosyltransferase
MQILQGEAWVQSQGKRFEDLCIATALMPVGIPLAALGALSVALFDRVDPRFTQERDGKDSIPFDIFKVKTMPHCQEDTPSGGNHDDPRASRTGRILRKLRIDELPQLANVIQGNMSIIGPRPLPPSEFAVAREVLGEKDFSEWQTVRHLGRPGFIDPFSVDYFSDGLPDTYRKQDFDKTIPRRVELETEYVLDTASLATDIQLFTQAAAIITTSAVRPLIAS